MIDHLELLSTLKVKKIYWVDDENAGPEDLDLTRLTGFLATKLASNDSEEHLKECLKSLKTELGNAPEASRLARGAARDITSAWEDRQNVEPLNAISEALERVIAVVPDDKDPKAIVNAMLAKLPQPFSAEEKRALASTFDGTGDWEWRPLSFSQWAQEHREILADHNDSENTALLIVDLQNDREGGVTSGEDVLEQWANWATQNDSMRSVFAIAFTSRFKPQEEIKEGRRYTDRLFPGGPKKNQLPVLVLSKSRLQIDEAGGDVTNNAAHDAFKRALGRLRACALHWALAEDVQEAFTASVQAAFTTLQELSIEELLMAVSGKHTYHEGASDIDTLVRMAAIAQRAELLSRIAKDDGVARTLIELRGLSEVFTEFERRVLDDTSGIERLRASEVHDPAKVVNALLSPIATGDIFEFTRDGRTEYQVLVSNICDLTLRGHTGRRKIQDGLLLTLSEQLDAGRAAKGDEDDKAHKSLPAFPEDSPLAGKRWAASYNMVSVVPLEVLDLCWTNKDGTCEWTEAAEVLSRLAPSQKLRLDQMLQQFGQEKDWARIASRLPGVDKEYVAAPGSSQPRHVRFAVRRVGRMAHAFVNAVSEGFGRNVARPSFEHDISAST
jgi:hypothetical protein